jgi:hypothetical protein
MFDRRLDRRFPCERHVDVAYFLDGRRCAIHKAAACDISESGLRLRLPEPAPPCDRLLVRTGGLVIAYRIRSRSEVEGVNYAGVEAIGPS